jgi:alpha-tubulin suppressor-like RCC1 family protein
VVDDGTLACKDQAPAVSHVVQIAGTCTVHDDGAVRCWGDNSNGELGDGSLSASATPVRVPGLDDVIDLQVAHTSACAVKRDKSLHCWGPNAVTEIGTINGALVPGQYLAGCRIHGADVECSVPTYGDDVDRMVFEPNVGPLKSAAIHRDGSVCVVDAKGRVTCRHGMADNGIDSKWRPLPAPGPIDDLQPLGVGFCARQRDGHVSCFVDHRYDDDEKFLDKPPPAPKLVLVPNLDHVMQLATGQSLACAITVSHDVWCWEADAPHPQPVEMPTLRGATQIAANHLHTCALRNGEVWCWGENEFGQLGDGTSKGLNDLVKTPVRAALPSEAMKVGVGRDSTCALLKTGQVWCWGANNSGQLGTLHRQRSDEPLRVVGIGPK